MAKRMTYWACFFVAFCLFSAPVGAEDLTLQASVDQTRVEVGDVVQLTVSISSEGLRDAPVPDVPLPGGVEMIGRTSSSSTSIQIINGAMTRTKTVSYIFSLKTTREGSFVIGPARVTYRGNRYDSSPIRIEVTKASGKSRTRPTPSAQQHFNPSELRQLEENLFVEAIPDKQSVYVGEQVTVSYKIFTRYNLNNVHYGQVPTFTGFWVESIFEAQRLDLKRENVEGRVFNAALLKRVALFPTTSGKQSLEQLEVICEIPRRGRTRSLFDFGFDSFHNQQVTVRAGALELDVKSLPLGAPQGFGGAVGQFQVSAEAIPTTVKAGDPIAVKVTVSGTGNLNGVNEPIRPKASYLKFYDPKTSVETRKEAGKLGGHKVFEYVVIPERAGSVQIPPFQLAYFDPIGERYRTAISQPIALTVQPGVQATQSVPMPRGRGEVRLLGEDIRYIKPDQTELVDQGQMLYQETWFWGMQVIPVLGFFGALFYNRHRVRLEGDVAYARRRRSRSEARRRLGEAERLMKAGEQGAFHAEVYRSLTVFLADRLNQQAAGFTADSAENLLVEAGVSEGAIAEVRAVFQTCDLARFASTEVSAEGMKALFARAERLIEELGRQI
ncbi:MAG: BatD family protein [bacterium]|nr:BatD family protein [bacterium]